MRIAMTLLALSLSLTACKKKNDAPAGGSDVVSGSAMTGSGSSMAGSDLGSGSAMAGSGSSMAANGSGSATPTVAAGSGAGSAMAGSGSGSGSTELAMAHHAGMCPSTVFGATTKASSKDGKVMVEITSDDKDAIAAIQKRTDESVKDKVENSASNAGSGHDQKGTHGGGIGICPLHVPEGATATTKKEAKGVLVTIATKDPKDAEALKTEIEGRIVKANDWVKANIKPGDAKNQGGDGGGKGDHGSNHSGKGNGQGSGKGDGTGSGSGSAKK